jgi:integrase/recombinase XerD
MSADAGTSTNTETGPETGPETDTGAGPGTIIDIGMGMGTGAGTRVGVSLPPPPSRRILGPMADRALQVYTSPQTKRAYQARLMEYLADCGGRVNRDTMLDHLSRLRQQGVKPPTLAHTVSAIKCLAREATIQGLLSPADAYGIMQVTSPPRRGVRRGNWLTLDQCHALMQAPDRTTVRGQRDAALLAVLLGCGLRRTEASTIPWTCYQSREGRMVLIDFLGKGGRLRSVPVAEWVRAELDAWKELSVSLHIFGIGPDQIWLLVRKYAALAHIPALSPHDLRRTLAQLLRRSGAELEQIQAILGHASIITTERYLGTSLELRKGKAAVDRLDLRQQNRTGHTTDNTPGR